MRMHVTRWTPDTCGCTIDFEWDRDEVVDETHDRTLTPKQVIKLCPIHAARGVRNRPKDVWDTIMGENNNKNTALRLVVEQFPELGPVESLKWEFDDNRVVHVKLPKNSDPARLTRASVKIDSELGTGKAIVETEK